MNPATAATIERPKVGRPKGKRTERDDMSVKLDRAIGSRATIIAKYEAIPLAQFLSDILGPIIDKKYAQLMRKLEADKGQEGGA